MGTKTINLSDDAYARLKALKREGESFSDVVNRITGKHALLDLVGILSAEEGAELAEHVQALRERTRRELDERHREMTG